MPFKRNRTFIHEKPPFQYSDLETIHDASARTYVTPEGNKYPSITTVLGVRSRGDIQEWRNRVGAKEADRIARHASTRGNALHNLAERYLNNEETVMTGKEMPHVQLSFKAVQKILDDNIGKILLQEHPLYSDIFKLAGRVDLVAEFANEISIVDFKTSSRVKTAADITSYKIQAAFYAAAFYERTGIPIRQIVIIMAVDGKAEPLVFKDSPYVWLPELIKVREEYDREKIFGR